MKRKKSAGSGGKLTSFFRNAAGINIDEEDRCVVCSKTVKRIHIESHTALCIEKHSAHPAAEGLPQSQMNAGEQLFASPVNIFSQMLQASKLGNKTTIKFRLDIIDGKIAPLLFFPNEIEVVRGTYYGAVESSSGGGTSSKALTTVWQCEVKVKNMNLHFGHGAPGGTYIGADGISTTDLSHLEDVIVKVQTNIRPVAVGAATARSSTAAAAATTDASSHAVHPSTFKSILQKLLRRRQSDSAVKIALALAEIAPLEFFRRAPIIILEDSVLHPLYPVLVWVMMAAGKGYCPPDPLLALCLSIVGGAAACHYRDISSSVLLDFRSSPLYAETLQGSDGDGEDDGDGGMAGDEVEGDTGDAVGIADGQGSKSVSLKAAAPSAARSLLLSILLRGSFGGMSGDVAMLTAYAQLWFDRLYRECSASVSSPSGVCALHTYVHPRYILDLYECGFWGGKILALSEPPALPAGNSGSCLLRALVARVEEGLRHELCLSLVDYRALGVQPLSRQDFLAAGIDFHVERGLVPFLMDCCEDAVQSCLDDTEYAEEAVKASIWYFSSSVSNHRAVDASFVADGAGVAARIDRLLVSLDGAALADMLAKKRQLAKVWSIIAGRLATYTAVKADEAFKRYTRARAQGER